MCGIEPSNLAVELPEFRIGSDSVDWYQVEIDRYHELSDKFLEDTAQFESIETAESEQGRQAEFIKLLSGFSKPFLQS